MSTVLKNIRRRLMTAGSGSEDQSLDPLIDKFFNQETDPSDSELHEFAEDNGVDHQRMEERIYHRFDRDNKGSKQQAYTLVLPLANAPSPACWTTFDKLTKETGIAINYVVSDTNPNQVYEVPVVKGDEEARLISALRKLGIRYSPRKPGVYALNIAGAIIFLVFLDQA